MSSTHTIKVTHKEVDGVHFFTSVSGHGKGLCVGHSNLKMAFEEVGIQLTNILCANLGASVEVTPAVSYEEFEQWLNQKKAIQTPNIVPLAEMNWRHAA